MEFLKPSKGFIQIKKSKESYRKKTSIQRKHIWCYRSVVQYLHCLRVDPLHINNGNKTKAFLVLFLLTIFVDIPYLWGTGMDSASWKLSLHFAYIFRIARNFSIKIWNSYQSFDKNILTTLYLKSEMSAHAKIAINLYHILFTNFLQFMKLKPSLGILFDKSSWSMILSTCSRNCFQKGNLVHKIHGSFTKLIMC